MPCGDETADSSAFAGESEEAVTNGLRIRGGELRRQFIPDQRSAAGNFSSMKNISTLHE
jgi:hypothetical protein